MDIAHVADNILSNSQALSQLTNLAPISVSSVVPIQNAPPNPSSQSVLILTLTPEQINSLHNNPSNISSILSGISSPVVSVNSSDGSVALPPIKKVPPKKNYRQRGAIELPRWRGKPAEELVEGFTWKDLMLLLERYATDHSQSEIDLTDFARSGAFPVKIRKKGLFKCGLEFCCREWCKADILFWIKKSVFGSNFKWKLPPEPENYVSQYISSDEAMTTTHPTNISIDHGSDEENSELNKSTNKEEINKNESMHLDPSDSIPALAELANSIGASNALRVISSSNKKSPGRAKKSKYEVKKRDCSKGSIWWKVLKEGQRIAQWYSLNTIRGEKFEGDIMEAIRTFENWLDHNPTEVINYDVTNSTNSEDHVPDPEPKTIDKKRKDPKDDERDSPNKKSRTLEDASLEQKINVLNSSMTPSMSTSMTPSMTPSENASIPNIIL